MTSALLVTLIRAHDFCASISDELLQDFTGEAKDDIRAAATFIEDSALPTPVKQHILNELELARAQIFGAARNVPACGDIVARLRRQLANEIAAQLGQMLPYNEAFYPRLALT